MSLRIATPDDLDAICLLAEEIVESHSREAPHIFAPLPGLERDRAFWASNIGADGTVVLLACDGSTLQGFITARILPVNPLSFILPRRVCAIGTIIVAQPYQRQGICQQLLAAVQDWAKNEGACEVRLEVFDFNRGAIALYERAGFLPQSHIMTRAIKP